MTQPLASPSRDRIAVLDVLRGIAVGGILLANVFVFFGIFLLTPAEAGALSTARWDRAVTFLEHVLVEGKFYSIFSLLFGVGFGLQLGGGDPEAIPRFRRRLRILLAIGTFHAVFIWAGDILLLYALLGFSMPWFARKSDAALLRWVLGLLAAPSALYVVALAIWTVAVGTPAPEAGTVANMPPWIVAIFARVGTGGVIDAFVGNLLLLAGRWADLFVTVRFPKVLGMFVLGLWVARQGMATNPSAHRGTLRRWRLLGLGVGLPMNILAAWAFARWPYLPPSPWAFVGVIGQAAGFPLLALGYASAVTLLVVDGRRLLSHMAPVGRMALTNYLSHSVICGVLSYGFGLGLWMTIGALPAMAIAAIVVLCQIPLSRWWLSRYQFGPAEWVWRRLTYGRPLPIRRPS